jgi:hypothetical protein
MTSADAHTTAAVSRKADKNEQMTGVRTKAHSRRSKLVGVGDQGNLKNAKEVAATNLLVDAFARSSSVLEPGRF